LQVNLGSSATPLRNDTTCPRVHPQDSIWLGSFEITAASSWVSGSSSNPVWLPGTPTSVSVYDNPPIANATVCNSLGSGTTLTSGKLENGTNGGSNPCSLLLNSTVTVTVHAFIQGFYSGGGR